MEKLNQEILQLYLKHETINFFPRTSVTNKYLEQIKELNEYYDSLPEEKKEQINNKNIIEKLIELRIKIISEYQMHEDKEEASLFDAKVLECREAKSTNHTWFYRVRKLATDYDKLSPQIKKMCINKWIIDSMIKEIEDYEKGIQFEQLKKEAVAFDKRITELQKKKTNTLEWSSQVKEIIEDLGVLAKPVLELVEKNSILITLRQEADEIVERTSKEELLKESIAFDKKIADLQARKVWTLEWYEEVQELDVEFKYLKDEIKNLIKKEGVLLTLKQEATEVYESHKFERIKTDAEFFDRKIKSLDEHRKATIEWAREVLDLDKAFTSLDSMEKDLIKCIATLATLKQEALVLVDKFNKNDYYLMADSFDTEVLHLEKNRALNSSWAAAVESLDEKYDSFENIAKDLVKQYGKLVNLKQEATNIKSRINFGQKNDVAMQFDDKVMDTLRSKNDSVEWINEVKALDVEYSALAESIKELVTKALVLSELRAQAREVKKLLEYYETKASAITFDDRLLECKDYKNNSLDWHQEVMDLEKEYNQLSPIVKELLDNKGMIGTLKHDANEIKKEIFNDNYKKIANEVDKKIIQCEKDHEKTFEWIQEVNELKKMFDSLSPEIKAFSSKAKLLDLLFAETISIKKEKALAEIKAKAKSLDNEVESVCIKVSKEMPHYKEMLYLQEKFESADEEVAFYCECKKVLYITVQKSFKYNKRLEKQIAKINKKTLK